MNHKGNMNMKLSFAVVALLLSSSFAQAGVLDDIKADFENFVDTFPAHEADGYRDTGCDVDQQVAIKNADGVVLYSNNPTCPNVTSGTAQTDVTPPGDDDGEVDGGDNGGFDPGCDVGPVKDDNGHGPKKGHGKK